MALCETRTRPGSHHAPIHGASGDPADFGCKLLNPATPSEKALDFAGFIAVLALLRSAFVDTHLRRLRRDAALTGPPS